MAEKKRCTYCEKERHEVEARRIVVRGKVLRMTSCPTCFAEFTERYIPFISEKEKEELEDR